MQKSLYALAKVAFIGGSLVPKIGGHTPYEPIRAGTAIVSGPFVDNFAPEFTALNSAGGCLVATSEQLAKALSDAFANAEVLQENAARVLPPLNDQDQIFAKIATCLEQNP